MFWKTWKLDDWASFSFNALAISYAIIIPKYFLHDSKIWEHWEYPAIISTLIITVILWIKLGINKVLPKNISSYFVGSIEVTVCLLWFGVAIYIFSGPDDDIQSWRRIIMWSLSFVGALQAGINFYLSKSVSDEERALSFKIGFYYSDLPVAFGFVILALCSQFVWPITECVNAFLTGAIAFQMLYTNFVWAYADNAIMRGRLTNKLQNKEAK